MKESEDWRNSLPHHLLKKSLLESKFEHVTKVGTIKGTDSDRDPSAVSKTCLVHVNCLN